MTTGTHTLPAPDTTQIAVVQGMIRDAPTRAGRGGPGRTAGIAITNPDPAGVLA